MKYTGTNRYIVLYDRVGEVDNKVIYADKYKIFGDRFVCFITGDVTVAFFVLSNVKGFWLDE